MMRLGTAWMFALVLVIPGCIEEHPDWVADAPGTSTGTTGTPVASATSDPQTAGSSTSSQETGARIEEIEVGASIVECLYVPDETTGTPVSCLDDGVITVDLVDNNLGGVPTTGYLRFDLPSDALQGEVLAMTLTLTTVAGSDAPSSGQIWLTESFSTQDLAVLEPQQTGSFALAPEMPAPARQAVTFQLSLQLLSEEWVEGDPLCLQVFPTETNGVEYFALSGEAPPRLTIRVQRN